MRKKDDTLQATLLELARRTADEEGIAAINIRYLARKAGVATGTVYNYFSSKDEILLAITEEYWKQTLAEMENVITARTFCGQLREIFAFLRKQIDESAGKLMSSLGSAETTGLKRMTVMQSALESALSRKMAQDPDVRRDIWNDSFTRDQFAHFILMNMIMLLKSGAEDMDFLIVIIERTIFHEPAAFHLPK
jgi:AcrR family transcriptional regulator